MLKNSISVYFPTVTKDGHLINEQLANNLKRELAALMCELFGGYTAMPSLGGLSNNDCPWAIAEEEIMIVTSYTDDLGMQHFDHVYAFVEELADRLQQKYIAIVDNGTMHFIAPRNVLENEQKPKQKNSEKNELPETKRATFDECKI